jgi:hypothetical protein
MAVIKATNSKTGGNLKKLVNYVTKEEKTEQKYISGQNCNPQTALEEMMVTKKLFEKEEGREYKHFVQSFKPGEVTAEKAHQIALEWSQKQFKGHEVLIATHEDKKHIHTHFVVNSVNFEDGSKFRQSKQGLSEMKLSSDRICEREGLSVIHEKSKEITSFNQNKYKAIERAFEGNYKSYVVDTALSVNKSLTTSMSKGDFIKNMESQGYSVKWTDTNKNVTFTNAEGQKVRLNNLQKTFKEEKYSKEGLKSEFTKLRGKDLVKTTDSIRGSRTEQQPNQTTRTEHKGENGVRKHTSKREFGDIQATIRGVEQGVKGNPKQDVGNIKQSPERKARGDNEDLQSDDKTSSRTKNKQQNDRGSHEPRIEPIEPQHRKTIEPAKPKNKSRSYDFER